MKKSIILALALAVPAMAGDGKAPVTVVDVPAIVPAPAAPSAFGVEVGAVYTSALNDVVEGVDGVNTWGVDVTGVYNLTPNWATTLRVGWATGSDDLTPVEELEVDTVNIMAGIRYSAPITESLTWYAGGEIGVGYVNYTDTFFGDEDDFEDWGFAYGVETGLQYAVTPCLYLYSALHYSGNFAEPEIADGYDTKSHSGWGVRMGLGGKF